MSTSDRMEHVEAFDADALLAEIKAEGKPFQLGGQTFVLPPPATWSDTVTVAATANDLVALGREILGADDYARFTAAGGTTMFLQRLYEVLFGLSMGESPASSPS